MSARSVESLLTSLRQSAGRPRGAGQVDVRFGAAVAPERLAAIDDKPTFIADTIAFFDKVNTEDKLVVQGTKEGERHRCRRRVRCCGWNARSTVSSATSPAASVPPPKPSEVSETSKSWRRGWQT